MRWLVVCVCVSVRGAEQQGGGASHTPTPCTCPRRPDRLPCTFPCPRLTLDQVHAHTQGVGVAASIAAARTPRPHEHPASPAPFGPGVVEANGGGGSGGGAGGGGGVGAGVAGGEQGDRDTGGMMHADLGGLNAFAPPAQGNGNGNGNAGGDPPGDTYVQLGGVASTVTSDSSGGAELRRDGERSPASMLGQVDRPARPSSTVTAGATSANGPRLPPLGPGMRVRPRRVGVSR